MGQQRRPCIQGKTAEQTSFLLFLLFSGTIRKKISLLFVSALKNTRNLNNGGPK